ncbi:DUF6518 family protein [Cellulomonas cellasea]|uniref:Uncharacterized protein n=1 Tax=Cellulomonas cellasea TaxID=43670 RepID=A0A4Y3KTP3_9CELL|nr:DUF6518 family protein [Cellulomonas cellasea]GEA87801.1 hypothetical protein CCE01nite_17500 [Cellulomonas cellasea]
MPETTTPDVTRALPPDARPDHRTGRVRVAVVPLASAALGALTLTAQGALPDAAVPFANSAGGWTLLTVLLVLWSRARSRTAAVLGAASFVLLVLGYSASAHMHGLFYDPTFFGTIGLVAGPVVGVATAWLREHGLRAALGTAVLAGIGLGEAVYGLTSVVESTGAAYWVVLGAGALALLAGMLARRVRGAVPVLVATLGTAVVAGAFAVAYRVVGSIG